LNRVPTYESAAPGFQLEVSSKLADRCLRDFLAVMTLKGPRTSHRSHHIPRQLHTTHQAAVGARSNTGICGVSLPSSSITPSDGSDEPSGTLSPPGREPSRASDRGRGMGCKHHCHGIVLRTTLLDTGQGVVTGGRRGIDTGAASPLGFVHQDHPKTYSCGRPNAGASSEQLA
jgi:hypothetical protein